MTTAEQLATYRDDAKQLVAKLYKDEQGRTFVLTDGQADIFNLIFKKLVPRNHIESFTRYGKSHTIAMAILTRICVFPERWCVAAGNDDQAHIITSHLITHIFDNEFTRQRFMIGKGEKEEEIRRYRNKSRLNFRLEDGLMGEVFVTNAKGAMGFGAPNVVLDEAALVEDQDEALVFRMLGDQTENFYFKIGNPWESGHFRSSAADDSFLKIRIDYWQGVKEGRITPQMVDEARKRPFFDVLYECKFPKLSSDDAGWVPLLSREDIGRALVDSWVPFGPSRLGGDVAGGGKNFSVLVERSHNMARILEESHEPDTMAFAEKIITQAGANNVKLGDVFVDKVGVGKGVVDILARQKLATSFQGVNAGDKFEQGEKDGELYLNLRAKMYWKLREWILSGGKLLRQGDPEANWYQLTKIKYRHKLEGMQGKLQIMPKEQMLKEGVQSPDHADALSLTFARDETPVASDIVQRIIRQAENTASDPY